MKNVLKIVAFASTISALNACGAKDETKEESQVASLFSSSTAEFNLGAHVASKNSEKPILPRYVDASSSGISFGGKKSFLVSNNLIYKSEKQKVSAQYYIDAFALEKQLSRGHFVEVLVQAQTDTPEASYEYRYLGNTAKKDKTSSRRNIVLYRAQPEFTLPTPIIPSLSVNLGGSVSGDVNIDIGPRIDVSRKTIELEVIPKINLVGDVKATIVALFAEAGVKGNVQIVKATMPISGGIAATNRSVGPVISLKPLKIEALGGGIDLFATLSVGNVLPSPAKNLWKLVFGKGREYTYPLIGWDSLDYIPVTGYDYPAKK